MRHWTKKGVSTVCRSCRKCCNYCGQRFQVFKRAGKTCSEMTGPGGVVYVSRRLHDTVHLEHRCDGRAYGGCQAGCLIFWKEAWLKHVGASASQGQLARACCCPIEPLLPMALAAAPKIRFLRQPRIRVRTDDIRYSCQATQLLECHHSPQVVGRSAICRSLSLRQQFPEYRA